jgi:hypothetical protein
MNPQKPEPALSAYSSELPREPQSSSLAPGFTCICTLLATLGVPGYGCLCVQNLGSRLAGYSFPDTPVRVDE